MWDPWQPFTETQLQFHPGNTPQEAPAAPPATCMQPAARLCALPVALLPREQLSRHSPKLWDMHGIPMVPDWDPSLSGAHPWELGAGGSTYRAARAGICSWRRWLAARLPPWAAPSQLLSAPAGGGRSSAQPVGSRLLLDSPGSCPGQQLCLVFHEGTAL